LNDNNFLSKINNPNYTYVIAEAGLNHNGSIDLAKKLIDLAKEAGADAVKFQKRTVEKLAIKSYLDQKDDRFPEFGNTYKEIRDHLEFNYDEYKIIKTYTEKCGLDFICTAFDNDAVDFLKSLDVSIIKLASHSATNLELLAYIAKSNVTTILSTGMTDLDDVDRAYSIFKSNSAKLILLHCVSSYPTPMNECNLKMLDVMRSRYDAPVGYSGHEIGYLPTLVAVAKGAVAIERHYTLDNNMVGFDHKMSLGPSEFISMVKDIRAISDVLGTGEKIVSEKEWITRKKYQVSAVSSKPIKAGDLLTKDFIKYCNPGTGIPPKSIDTILGKKALIDINEDELLSKDFFS